MCWLILKTQVEELMLCKKDVPAIAQNKWLTEHIPEEQPSYSACMPFQQAPLISMVLTSQRNMYRAAAHTSQEKIPPKVLPIRGRQQGRLHDGNLH